MRVRFAVLLLALIAGLTSLLLMAASSEGQSWTATWTQRGNPLGGPRGWVGAAFDAAALDKGDGVLELEVVGRDRDEVDGSLGEGAIN